MKKIRCPKCDEAILFDESQYEAGRVLVFECPECHKRFRLRMPSVRQTGENVSDSERKKPLAVLVVLENAFHYKQEISLYEGENRIGRYVKGTRINAPIKTVDPSVDETHCVFTLFWSVEKGLRIILRDAPSNTGTFVHNQLVGVGEQVVVEDGAVITIGATTMILRTGKNME